MLPIRLHPDGAGGEPHAGRGAAAGLEPRKPDRPAAPFAATRVGPGLQTTCERVLRHSEQLRDQTRLDAWLFGIMRNLWIDELRRRRARHHEDIEAAVDVIGDHGHALVDDEISLDPTRLEERGRCARAGPADLLVLTDTLEIQRVLLQGVTQPC